MPGPLWLEMESGVDDLTEMHAWVARGELVAIESISAQLRRALERANAARALRLLPPLALRYKFSHGDRGPPRGIAQLTVISGRKGWRPRPCTR